MGITVGNTDGRMPMKSLIAPMLASVSFATFMICGMVAASSVDVPYRPHEFQNLNASIWTSAPVRIDPAGQNFEQLARVAPAPATSQTLALRDPIADQWHAGTEKMQDRNAGQTAVATGSASNALCQQRYRSYRAEDNTYQPLSGGPRRQCELSSSSASVGNAPSTALSDAVADNSSPNREAWCSARYSSYNPSDETYQPFGGGNRRICTPPAKAGSNG
jgi:hypothetical protein